MARIEIYAPHSPAQDMLVYFEGKRLTQPGNKVFSSFWDDESLTKLLSEKQIKEFQAGKYIFNVPTWKVILLQGKKAPKDNTEIKFLMQWD